jgi:integrase/recombinase XerD
MPVITLTDGFEFYRSYGLGVENRSDSTIRFKETPVRLLINYLGYDPPLKEISERHIVGFLEWLRQRPKNEYHPSGNKPQGKITDITINTYFRGLRALFNWLVKHNIIEENPIVTVEEPSYDEKLPKNLKADEIERTIKEIDLNTYSGFRDTTIIILMSDIGLRASELISLKLDDLDIRAGDLRVTRQKTGTQQIIGFHNKTGGLITTYVMHWHPESQFEELFLTEDARPLTCDRLAKILKHRGDKIGIHLNPHLLRHTAAVLKRRLENWDAERIQNLLGHSTSKMTRLYIQAAGDEDLREAFKKPGWVDKLKF